MLPAKSEDIAALLLTWNSGDRQALEELLPLVYDELRRIAKLHLGKEQRPDHTLQPAALVHEAYLRLGDRCNVRWRGPAHFFAVAATTMRRILVEHARRRGAAKRDAGKPKLSLAGAINVGAERTPDLVALDDCLTALARVNPLGASIVELRFFGGLSVDETAEVVGRSRATVIRKWRVIKAWLYRELSGRGEMGSQQSAGGSAQRTEPGKSAGFDRHAVRARAARSPTELSRGIKQKR